MSHDNKRPTRPSWLRSASFEQVAGMVAAPADLERLLESDFEEMAASGLGPSAHAEALVLPRGKVADVTLSNGRVIKGADTTPATPWRSFSGSVPQSFEGSITPDLRSALDGGDKRAGAEGASATRGRFSDLRATAEGFDLLSGKNCREMTRWVRKALIDKSRVTLRTLRRGFDEPLDYTLMFPLPLQSDGNQTGADIVTSDSVIGKLASYYYGWYMLRTSEGEADMDNALKVFTDYAWQMPGSLDIMPTSRYSRSRAWLEKVPKVARELLPRFHDVRTAVNLALVQMLGPERVAGKYKRYKSPGYFKYWPDLSGFNKASGRGFSYPSNSTSTGDDPRNAWMKTDYSAVKRAWHEYAVNNAPLIFRALKDGRFVTCEHRIERFTRDLERVQVGGTRKNNPESLLASAKELGLEPGSSISWQQTGELDSKARELVQFYDFTDEVVGRASFYLPSEVRRAFEKELEFGSDGVASTTKTLKDGTRVKVIKFRSGWVMLRSRWFYQGAFPLQSTMGQIVRWMSYFTEKSSFGYPTASKATLERFERTRLDARCSWTPKDFSHFETASTGSFGTWISLFTASEHIKRVLLELGIGVSPDLDGGHYAVNYTNSGQESTSLNAQLAGVTLSLIEVALLASTPGDFAQYARSYAFSSCVACVEAACLEFGLKFDDTLRAVQRQLSAKWCVNAFGDNEMIKEFAALGSTEAYQIKQEPLTARLRTSKGGVEAFTVTPSLNSDDGVVRYQTAGGSAEPDFARVARWLENEDISFEVADSVAMFGCRGDEVGRWSPDTNRQSARMLHCYEKRSNSLLAALALHLKSANDARSWRGFCFAFAALKTIHGIPVGSVRSYERADMFFERVALNGNSDFIDYAADLIEYAGTDERIWRSYLEQKIKAGWGLMDKETAILWTRSDTLDGKLQRQFGDLFLDYLESPLKGHSMVEHFIATNDLVKEVA